MRCARRAGVVNLSNLLSAPKSEGCSCATEISQASLAPISSRAGSWTPATCEARQGDEEARPAIGAAKQRSRPAIRGFATKAEEYDVISVDAGLVVLEGYDAGGFVANSAYVEGAVLCSGPLLTLWSVRRFEDVTADSLALLLLIKPAPDLLILGCGESIQRLDPKMQDWLAGNGISVECLDTANAVSTFNILNQEGRKVAAALLPSP